MKAPDSFASDTAANASGRTVLQRFGFAAAMTAAAFIIRAIFDKSLGPNKHVFVTFIVATILVSWYGGFWPSLLTSVAGLFLGTWFFLEPRHSFHIENSTDLVVAPILVQVCVIIFGRAMHLARERADTNARKAVEHQKQLEREVAVRREAEEEVRRLNGELEQRVESRTAELVATNQELESFTYSVSHDLRAPLRHIDGFAQVLEEEFGPHLPPEAQKFAQKIRRGSQNMGQLVDDLLNLSRVGKKDLTRHPTELAPLVEGVVAVAKLDAANRQIEWRIGELPVADCDAGLIRQDFANLLSNAVKYTRPRERARIEIGETKLNGETAIYVRDNGVGFNMKYAGKLFGVFQRLHRTEEFEGTGVGLATIARIIRKHGGRIWAEAELEKGATFYFTLEQPEPKSEAAANA